MIKTIQAVYAGDIPAELWDIIEFPLRGINGIVQVPDDKNQFSEWLKEQGYKFPDGWGWGWLAIWGIK